MGELLFKTGNYLLAGAINRMLTGAGLTLAVSGISLTAVNKLIANMDSTLEGLPALGLAMINLSGIDVAISLSASAVVARISIQNAQLFLTRLDD